MPARSAVVKGFVQGVGFRAYVINLASELGVSGSVWNRTDLAVQAEFEHEDPAILDEFARRLKLGPGRVDSVEITVLPDALGATDFHVGAIR
jgi:acylphosphatase